MSNRRWLYSISIFILVSYLSAFILDYLVYVFIGGFDTTAVSEYEQIYRSIIVMGWGLLRMYTPTFGVILSLIYLKESVIEVFKTYLKFNRNILKWYLTSPLLVYMAVGIYLLIGSYLNITDFSLQISEENILPKNIFLIVMLLSSYFAGITLNSLYAIGEEIGWRGFLLTHINKKTNLAISIILVGIIWGLWHGSAILLLGYAFPCKCLEGLTVYVIWLVILSISFSLVKLSSDSVLASSSLHGSLNSLWGLTVLLTFSNTPLISMGLIDIVSWSLLSLILILFIKKAKIQLKYPTNNKLSDYIDQYP